MSGRRGNGEGSIYLRKDGRWVARAYVLLPDGTYKRKDQYATTKKEVSEKLVSMLAQSAQGIPAEAANWTVAAFLKYWLEHIVKEERKPRTYQGYEVIVRNYLVPELGKKKLTRVTAADVRTLLQRVRTMCLCCRHGYDTRRPVSRRRCCALGKCCERRPSTRLMQQVHAVLKNAIQAAVREEIVARNVAKLVRQESPRYDTGVGINVEQAKRLREVAQHDRLYALYVMALYLGLRRGELLGLQWADVDVDHGVIRVNGALQRVSGKLLRVTPKSKASEREIPLVGVCADALREHRRRQAAERATADTAWVESGYVFTTIVGTPIEPDNLRRSWYPLRARAGLSTVRFHDLRHSCVTLLLDLGIPPHVVQAIVGHATIEVTMGVYAHASLEEKRRALKGLDDRLG